MLPRTLSLALTAMACSLLTFACNGSVSHDDGDGGGGGGGCGPAPQIPEGAWCPPSYSCIDGQWMDTAGACPDPCPASQPADGSSCSGLLGAQCTYEYPEEPCGPGPYTVTVTCTADGWLSQTNYCQPEPECPVDMPLSGTDCPPDLAGYPCFFSVETGCGPQPATATCDAGVWNVQLEAGAECGCVGLGTAEACAAAGPACRWLTPGCDPGVTVVTGCFPAADCIDCGDGASCETVSYNPCPPVENGPVCDACGAEAKVCLALL